jgi:Bacterial RNA polymerase, alpha chain C terminal domain
LNIQADRGPTSGFRGSRCCRAAAAELERWTTCASAVSCVEWSIEDATRSSPMPATDTKPVLHRFPPSELAGWRTYPVRVRGPRSSRCHDAPTLLVLSMDGGFVTSNCSVCGSKDLLTQQGFRSLDLWVSCPLCRERMQPGMVSVVSGSRYGAANYSYTCDACHLYIRLADILPHWEDLVAPPRVRDLNLSVRAARCLESQGIKTLAELCRWTADELLEVRNFGSTTLCEVEDKLAARGFRLHEA